MRLSLLLFAVLFLVLGTAYSIQVSGSAGDALLGNIIKDTSNKQTTDDSNLWSWGSVPAAHRVNESGKLVSTHTGLKPEQSVMETPFQLQGKSSPLSTNSPNATTDLNKQGVLLFKQKKYNEALSFFNRSIESNPSYVIAWTNKGMTLSKLNRSDESLDAFDKVIELSPESMNAWINRGNVLKALHRDNEAIAAFAKARELGYTG